MPVDRGVVLAEVAGPGASVGGLGIARVAGGKPFEDPWQQVERGTEQPRADGEVVEVVVLHRHGGLGEDPAGIEIRIHAVPGHAVVGVAIADGPRDRDRSAMARQQRRMLVDRAQPRHLEGGERDPPGEAPADREVRPIRPEQRRDRRLVTGEDDVDALWRGRVAQLGEVEARHRLPGGSPCAEDRHRFVAQLQEHGQEVLGDRLHGRDEHDPPARLSHRGECTGGLSTCAVG